MKTFKDLKTELAEKGHGAFFMGLTELYVVIQSTQYWRHYLSDDGSLAKGKP